MSETKYLIEPKAFSSSQWDELIACTDNFVPVSYQTQYNARPFKRPKKRIRLAILCLLNKVDSITNGPSEPEVFPGENRERIADLEKASEKLAAIIGEKFVTASLRLYELLTSDIYTDAPEYSERVEEIHKLLPIFFGKGE